MDEPRYARAGEWHECLEKWRAFTDDDPDATAEMAMFMAAPIDERFEMLAFQIGQIRQMISALGRRA